MASAQMEYAIDDSLIKRINYTSKEGNCSHGLIYGISSEEQLIISAAVFIQEGLKCGTFLDHFLKNRCVFPIGVDPKGVFLCNCDIKEISNIIPMNASLNVPEKLLCLHIDTVSGQTSLYLYNRLSKETTSVEHTLIDSYLDDNYAFIRLTSSIELAYKFSTKKTELQSNCVGAVQNAIKSLSEPNVFYELVTQEILLSHEQIIGADKSDTLAQVLHTIDKKADTIEPTKSKKNSTKFLPKIVTVDMLRKLSKTNQDEESVAPVLFYQRVDDMMVRVNTPIDFMLLVRGDVTLDKLAAMFYRACVRCLHSTQDVLINVEGTDIPKLEVSHYWMEKSMYPITLYAPSNSSDENLVDWRKALHVKLMLPADRPLFRKANRYNFNRETSSKMPLINPHIGLVLPKQLTDTGGEIYTVYGKVAYHHYMQDNFDDDKWGCAYRSLQTLVSWFNLQGYSIVNIPTHREIQQILVDIGDKEPSFVGSKQWIGSTEVSFVLDKLINVTSKILFVSSGADMATKGRELVNHFVNHGTPIMIGGGVLAHTIIGVYYNSKTGVIRFLILDPHYTGAEDLKTITEKGWCGWKAESFWDAKAYYNMCMPQRPHVF